MTQPHETVVFDVQRFSLHDGPGIRTVVFFKGCALACAWCQNPEALRAGPELAYASERCLPECDLCVTACPENALRRQRSARVDFARCTACGRCAEACPSAALRVLGRTVRPEALLEELLRDRDFYASSQGGVTLSGGEPVLQQAFLQELLPRVKEAGIHVALETCGAYPFALLEPLLPWIDLILFDVKAADSATHERFTTQGNEEILENLAELARRGVALEARMPVVPGWNDDPENVAGVARALRERGIESLTLLPYNHLWEAKLPTLATQRVPLGIRPPDDAHYAALRDAFAQHGVAARL